MNKNNKHRDQIEYRTLTLTRGHYWVDTWTFKNLFKKIKKKIKKPQSDMWHATWLIHVHLKKNLKKK